MPNNKVQFNLHNVHYAVMSETINDDGTKTYSYATPVHIPGAVTLTLDPSGESSTFYADGIAYYTTFANNGYEGDLEIARVPESMYTDIWQMTQDETNKVITEYADKETKPVALLYQIDGDQTGQYYVLYKCTFGRPGAGSTTNTNTKEPQTQSMAITATPRDDYKIKAHTTADTPDTVRNTWFAEVHDGAPRES